MFRLQATPDNHLQAYAAEGEVLDINPQSFGSIGVFAVKEMRRFYRHILLEKRFPHHTAIAFDHVGKSLFSALRMMGVTDFGTNQPAVSPYASENPFS
jgi:L-fucose isomerase-like protein